jgi:hypothetical protein
MKYAVLNEKGTQVGYDFTCLSEAQNFVSVNNGDAKGWYIKPISEGSSTPSTPQLLID